MIRWIRHGHNVLPTLAGASLVLVLLGCGAVGEQMGKGISAYERGDFPAAMNAWNQLNGLEDDMSDRTRTKYFLYRGLTYYALGVRHYARMYLSRGRREYTEHEYGFLDDATLALVDRALTDLMHSDT
ncbi:MAG: hypothetical protein U0359_14355 [Byssovorax sp.]